MGANTAWIYEFKIWIFFYTCKKLYCYCTCFVSQVISIIDEFINDNLFIIFIVLFRARQIPDTRIGWYIILQIVISTCGWCICKFDGAVTNIGGAMADGCWSFVLCLQFVSVLNGCTALHCSKANGWTVLISEVSFLFIRPSLPVPPVILYIDGHWPVNRSR